MLPSRQEIIEALALVETKHALIWGDEPCYLEWETIQLDHQLVMEDVSTEDLEAYYIAVFGEDKGD